MLLGSCNFQFDLPFVETHRVKEIRFRPRLPITWNYKDYNFSEIDYEMGKVAKRLNQRTKSMNMIPVDSDDDSEEDSDDEGFGDVKTKSQILSAGGEAEAEISDTESTEGHDSNRRKVRNKIPHAHPLKGTLVLFCCVWSEKNWMKMS